MAKLRILLVVAFLILVAVLIVFPYRGKAPIKIAYMGNLSGNGMKSDISACNGAVMGVDAVNAKGGIKGRQIKLSLYDFKGRAEKISGICLAMNEKQISLLIAPFVPENLLAQCRQESKGLILKAGFDASGVKSDNSQINLYFRVKDYGRQMANLAISRKTHSVAVMYDRTYFPHGLAFLEGFRHQYLKLNGQIKEELGFDSQGGVAIEGLVSNIQIINPKGLMVVASAQRTGQICALVRDKIPGIRLYAPPWAMNQELIKTGRQQIDGITGYLVKSQIDRQSAALSTFFAAYRSCYTSRPDMAALLGYEAVLILTEGIRNSASADPYLIKHTLLKLNRFKGMVSDYYLTEDDQFQPCFDLGEVRHSKIFNVE